MNYTKINKGILLWLNVFLFCSTLVAQNQQGAVKGTRTDKNFANTTEIHKTEKASDEQVLAQIEGDYGLGDVIHISNAPPISTILPSATLPKLLESLSPKPFPILLTAVHFKMPKNGSNKNKDVAENGTHSPFEKKDKNENTPRSNTSTKDEIPSKKPFLTLTEQKKAAIAAHNKVMSNKLASYNTNNTRTHRATTVRYDTKKSWFSFFNKKRTSTMPKTVKNKKSDRCYKF